MCEPTALLRERLSAVPGTAPGERKAILKSPLAGAPGAASPDPFADIFPPEMAQLTEQVRRVAPQETTLLLTGKAGTGKTWLARLIHQLSPRRGRPVPVVGCGR